MNYSLSGIDLHIVSHTFIYTRSWALVFRKLASKVY